MATRRRDAPTCGSQTILLPAFKDDGETFAFTMCNPPFFESMGVRRGGRGVATESMSLGVYGRLRLRRHSSSSPCATCGVYTVLAHLARPLAGVHLLAHIVCSQPLVLSRGTSAAAVQGALSRRSHLCPFRHLPCAH